MLIAAKRGASFCTSLGCRTVRSAPALGAERFVLHHPGVQNGSFCTTLGCRTVRSTRDELLSLYNEFNGGAERTKRNSANNYSTRKPPNFPSITSPPTKDARKSSPSRMLIINKPELGHETLAHDPNTEHSSAQTILTQLMRTMAHITCSAQRAKALMRPMPLRTPLAPSSMRFVLHHR